MPCRQSLDACTGLQQQSKLSRHQSSKEPDAPLQLRRQTQLLEFHARPLLVVRCAPRFLLLLVARFVQPRLIQRRQRVAVLEDGRNASPSRGRTGPTRDIVPYPRIHPETWHRAAAQVVIGQIQIRRGGASWANTNMADQHAKSPDVRSSAHRVGTSRRR